MIKVAFIAVLAMFQAFGLQTGPACFSRGHSWLAANRNAHWAVLDSGLVDLSTSLAVDDRTRQACKLRGRLLALQGQKGNLLRSEGTLKLWNKHTTYAVGAANRSPRNATNRSTANHPAVSAFCGKTGYSSTSPTYHQTSAARSPNFWPAKSSQRPDSRTLRPGRRYDPFTVGCRRPTIESESPQTALGFFFAPEVV